MLVLVAGAPPARGDDLEVHERSTLLDDRPGLAIDPMLRPALEGLGAVEDKEQTRIQLGPSTTLVLEGVSWVSEDSGASNDSLGRPALDPPARGWRANVRLSHDFGIFRLDATGSVNNVDSRYGSGTYVDLGLSATKTVKLSPWMTGWISLGVGRRNWRGTPPPGEAAATQVKLTVGTTFR